MLLCVPCCCQQGANARFQFAPAGWGASCRQCAVMSRVCPRLQLNTSRCLIGIKMSCSSCYILALNAGLQLLSVSSLHPFPGPTSALQRVHFNSCLCSLHTNERYSCDLCMIKNGYSCSTDSCVILSRDSCTRRRPETVALDS